MKPVPRVKKEAPKKREAAKKKVTKKSTGVTKRAAKATTKKKGSASKAKGSYPSYFKMIVKVLDRIGKASTPALLSEMSKDYPGLLNVSLQRRRINLKNALQDHVESGHIRRIKNSYTLLAKGRKAGLKSSPKKTPKTRKTSTTKKATTSKTKKTTTTATKKAKAKTTTKKSSTTEEKTKKATKPKKSASKKETTTEPKKSTKRKVPSTEETEPVTKKVPKVKETSTSNKGKGKGKGKAKDTTDSSVPVDKEVIVPAEGNIPLITTTGIAFNTTDLPHIRDDIKAIIGTLLQDDQVRVGIIANRGWLNGQYNLETLNFTDDASAVSGFVDNSYGEGSNWLQYYKQVLTTALTLPWAMNRVKKLILIGDEGTSSLFDRSLEADVGRLRTIGVDVYGFHHSQLVLLNEVLQELN